jgi:hypothetical protein
MTQANDTTHKIGDVRDLQGHSKKKVFTKLHISDKNKFFNI